MILIDLSSKSLVRILDNKGQCRPKIFSMSLIVVERFNLLLRTLFQQDFTHSVYFCPNERIQISTPASFSPKFVKKPPQMDWFSLSICAASEEKGLK